MDLNIFATQITQKGQAPLAGSASSALFGNGVLGTNLGNAGSTDFWNALLGNLAETPSDETTLKNNDVANDVSKETVKKETVDLALLQLALMGQDADQSLDEKLSELRIERIINNPENRIEQLTKLIDHLTSGLPSVQESNASVEELVSRLTKRLETLESSLDAFRNADFGDDGAPFQALIATGLNPSQLTNITSRIEEVETKLGRELTVEDLIAGVGNIIPVPGTEDDNLNAADIISLVEKVNENSSDTPFDITALSDGSDKIENGDIDLQNSEIETEAVAVNQPIQDLSNLNNKAALLNQITALVNAEKINPAGAPATAPDTSTASANNAEAPSFIPTRPVQGQMSNDEFNALFKQQFGNNNSANAGLNNAAKPNVAALQNLNSLPNLSQAGDVALPMNWADTLPASGILSELAGFDIQSGTPFSNTMQAVHHITSSQAQPGQAHPATSMVSAQISKAAKGAEGGKITLQLDPPELGRVEVRLEFGQKKSVTAHLVVEKPETLLLLQRDANALERALQDAGLDTAGDSLNYEMASENYNFNSNRDGNAQNGGTGSSDENAEDDDMIIETSMTWDVDPATGHVHYSILA